MNWDALTFVPIKEVIIDVRTMDTVFPAITFAMGSTIVQMVRQKRSLFDLNGFNFVVNQSKQVKTKVRRRAEMWEGFGDK